MSRIPYAITRILQWVNTLSMKRNARHFAGNISKCIFLNENVCILLKISLKFALKVLINNILALVQIMDWCRPEDKPLSEPTRTTRMPAFWDTPRRPVITHTKDSHQIPSQNQTKSKLQILKNCQKFNAGRMDGQTDGRTDGRSETSIPPNNFVA